MVAIEKLLSVEEAADILGIKPRTMKEWLRQGKIAGVKMGYREWRLRPADVEAFIERHRVGGIERQGEERAGGEA